MGIAALPTVAGAAATVKIPNPSRGSVELVAARVTVRFPGRVPPLHVLPSVGRNYRPNRYALLIGDRRLSVSDHRAIYIVLMEAIYPLANRPTGVGRADDTVTGIPLDEWIEELFGVYGYSATPLSAKELDDLFNSKSDSRLGLSDFLDFLPNLDTVTFGAKNYGEGKFDWGMSKDKEGWSLWGDLGLGDQALSDLRPKIEKELDIKLSPPTVGKEFRCAVSGLATNLLVPPVRQGSQPDTFTLWFTVKCENDQFGHLTIDFTNAIADGWSPSNATPPDGWALESGLNTFSFKAREPLAAGQDARFEIELRGDSGAHPPPSGSGFPLTAWNHASQDFKDFKQFEFST
ncbi:MAG TPA: hypothetical protein VGH24_11590 [Solirubrobacteraceae bacterium]